jgi:hypothetical protein
MVGIKTYEGFLKNLMDRLARRVNFSSFAIFGSVARGEARKGSDIDLLIVYKDCSDPLAEFLRVLSEMKDEEEYKKLVKIGLRPDPYPIFMTEKEIWEKPFILLDILDHGIIFHDDGTLRKRLDALKKRLQELGSKKVLLPDGRWYWDLKPDWKPGEVIRL